MGEIFSFDRRPVLTSIIGSERFPESVEFEAADDADDREPTELTLGEISRLEKAIQENVSLLLLATSFPSPPPTHIVLQQPHKIDWRKVAATVGRTVGECHAHWKASLEREAAKAVIQLPPDHDVVAFLENLPNLRLKDLKIEMQMRKLPVSGNKTDLTMRLRRAIYEEQVWKDAEIADLAECIKLHGCNWQAVSAELKKKNWIRDPSFCDNTTRVLVSSKKGGFDQFAHVLEDGAPKLAEASQVAAAVPPIATMRAPVVALAPQKEGAR